MDYLDSNETRVPSNVTGKDFGIATVSYFNLRNFDLSKISSYHSTWILGNRLRLLVKCDDVVQKLAIDILGK